MERAEFNFVFIFIHFQPKTFPHSVMPFTRPRSAADIMSRSLLPTLDGLPYGLSMNFKDFGFKILFHSTNFFLILDSNVTLPGAAEGQPMSRSSFASFHLTGIKTGSGKVMTSSVDRLFENDAEVFHSSNFGEFQVRPLKKNLFNNLNE